MFRKKASERLASPDQLDQLLQVVKPKNWVPLIVVGILLLGAVLWGFLGNIPVTAEGRAILVYPQQVHSFQSPATGVLESLSVRVGQMIQKDQTLGRLSLADINKQLQQAIQRRDSLAKRNKAMTDMERAHAKAERDVIERHQGILEGRMEAIRSRADELQRENEKYSKEQHRKLKESARLSKEMRDALTQRVAIYQTSFEEGLASQETLVNARHDLVQTELRLLEVEAREHALKLFEIEAKQAHSKEMDRVDDLNVRHQELGLRLPQIARRLLESDLTNQKEKEEIQQEIERLQNLIQNEGVIKSPYSGRILEVTVSAGTIVSRGMRLGAMAAEDPTMALQCLAYFPVREGKKIVLDLPALVSPASVQKQKYGSVRAEISQVSKFLVTTEAATNLVGNREMAEELTAGGYHIEVRATLLTDSSTHSGFEWSSGEGPEQEITAGTTASIRVTIEERPPLSFILPQLKKWLGAQ